MATTATEDAAEILRMALPMMSQHGVAVTPRNYAIWYRYLSGSNPALRERIDELITTGEGFSDELNDELFEEYISECNLNRLSGIRDEIQQIIGDVGSTLSDAGSRADDFVDVLEQFMEELKSGSDRVALRRLITGLADKTRAMSSSTEELRGEFERTNQEIEKLKAQLDRAREEACVDPLTRLANRRVLFDSMQAIAEGPSDDGDALLLLDIDHFKRINDRYGHLVGDKVIRFVAGAIKRQAHGKALAARYGGEEFVLLLPGVPLEKAANIGEQIRRQVEEAKLVRSGTKEPLGRITLSCGIARYRHGEAPTHWLERADQALYRAKEIGRNRVVVEAPGAARAKVG